MGARKPYTNPANTFPETAIITHMIKTAVAALRRAILAIV
jgi:hypothetical protein